MKAHHQAEQEVAKANKKNETVLKKRKYNYDRYHRLADTKTRSSSLAGSKPSKKQPTKKKLLSKRLPKVRPKGFEAV